jgi:hypothetical protein
MLVVWMVVLACLADVVRVRRRGLGFGCVMAMMVKTKRRKSSIETTE